jgi:hypothetical protein
VEFILRFFTSFRMTDEGLRVTEKAEFTLSPSLTLRINLANVFRITKEGFYTFHKSSVTG